MGKGEADDERRRSKSRSAARSCQRVAVMAEGDCSHRQSSGRSRFALYVQVEPVIAGHDQDTRGVGARGLRSDQGCLSSRTSRSRASNRDSAGRFKV